MLSKQGGEQQRIPGQQQGIMQKPKHKSATVLVEQNNLTCSESKSMISETKEFVTSDQSTFLDMETTTAEENKDANFETGSEETTGSVTEGIIIAEYEEKTVPQQKGPHEETKHWTLRKMNILDIEPYVKLFVYQKAIC